MNPYVLGKLKEWKASPLLFVTECIGATPSKQQAEALASLNQSKRISIRSGHGTGKSTLAAWRILHFMTTRAFPKVVCTAPTARQLYDVLWPALSQWLRVSQVKDEFILQKDKMFHRDAQKEWWCRAVSPSSKASKDDQAETIAGFHGNHLLLLVDEASGVSESVYVTLEGAMTQEDNHIMLTGNMTKNFGYFYDTHFHPEIRQRWKKFHWDARKSEQVTESMILYFKEKYGEDSNVFRIRVTGDPPLDDENSFIPLRDAVQCIGNEIEVDPEWPLTLSVDVARAGSDKSIILPRRGFKIYPWTQYQQIDTMELSNHIVCHFNDLEAYSVGVDSIGVGGGVIDWLQRDPRGIGYKKAFAVQTTDAATDNRKHHRLREQLWDLVRYNCRFAKYSFPDVVVKRGGMDINIGHELANELSMIRMLEPDSNGAIHLESKKDMKERGIASPNIADALCISEYINPMTMASWTSSTRAKENKAFDRARPKQMKLFSRDSWMVS